MVGVDSGSKILLEIHNASSKWNTIPLQQKSSYAYTAEVPAATVIPGVLNYRIIVQKDTLFTVFPGNHKEPPYAWDSYTNETWQTSVAAENAIADLFNPSGDRGDLVPYNEDWRDNTIDYVTDENPSQFIIKATMGKPTAGQLMGWQTFVGNKLSGREGELSSFKKLVLRARTNSAAPVRIKVGLITKEAFCFTALVPLNNEFRDIEISLNSLLPDSALLLPRPYPGFQPLWLKAASTALFSLADVEKLQITFGQDASPKDSAKPLILEVASIVLRKE